jgi:hypothetical protein
LYHAVTAATSAPNAIDCGSRPSITERRSLVVPDVPVDPVPEPALAEAAGLAADEGAALAEGLAADEAAALDASVSVDAGVLLGASDDVASADATADEDPRAVWPDGVAAAPNPEIVPLCWDREAGENARITPRVTVAMNPAIMPASHADLGARKPASMGGASGTGRKRNETTAPRIGSQLSACGDCTQAM